MTKAPTLTTDRLILRGHTVDDFADTAALWADPRVTEHITGEVQTSETSWQRLLRYEGHWRFMDYGYFAVTDRAGAFLGCVGLADYKRQIEPMRSLAPEAGWAFLPNAQGQGFAAEAVNRMLRWADTVLKAPRTHCILAPEHAASLRLADRTGFSAMQSVFFKGDNFVILTRENPLF
ncbi:GNAT family N-acetyltransferase [Oceaniovalibus sp. ACAM 378]|uniref:GNAT family N-acetyltransferase n=1 Tax=Oceaniovalibus sp. ACAM 378 TaxID=2599923 RepID=UPI0011D3E14C|nr:GNAT family N-acetyltransferase [Oceaniovalibus sp. ACAM 378]TYB90646.1 GNAT family N-acetyltransferase [Oceaniovalibus sp. ACAM 378]